MELFTIQCTTCKARLVVKNESVIGDILACPKCNSMVQVVPPVGWQRAETADRATGEPSSVASSATPDAARPTPVAKKSPPRKAAAAIPPTLPARLASHDPAEAASRASTALDSTTAATQPAPRAAEPAPATAEATPALLALAMARVQRDWVFLSAALLGGVALGATVWLVVLMQATEPKIVADARPADTAAAEQPPAAPPTTAAKISPRPPVASPPQATPLATPPETAPPSKPAAQDTDEPLPVTAEQPRPQTADPPADAPSPEPAADPMPKKPGPSLKLEPVPTGSGPAPASIGAFLSPGASVSSAGNAAPAGTTADEDPIEAITTDAVDADPTEEESSLARDEIERRLSVSLAGARFVDVPLAHFVTFITDITGVPVLIDDAALAGAGQNRRVAVTVQLAKTTAGNALHAALDPAGLTYSVDEGRIVVTRK